MAVTSIEPIGKGKRGGTLDDSFKRNLKVPYRLYTNSNTTSEAAVMAYLASYIEIGEEHEEDSFALLKSWSWQETDNPRIWEATAEYSTETKDQTQQAENPLAEPPDISWDDERVAVAYQKDLNGDAFTNSAGDPFDPAPTVEVQTDIVNILQNMPFFNRGFAADYRNHYNSTTLWGEAAGQVLMTKFSGKRAIKNGIVYFAWTMQFKFLNDSTNSWAYLGLLDAGYRYWTGTQAVTICDKNGQPLSKPTLLDGDGLPLLANSGVDAVFLPFTIRNGADFSTLMLPPEV